MSKIIFYTTRTSVSEQADDYGFKLSSELLKASQPEPQKAIDEADDLDLNNQSLDQISQADAPRKPAP